MARWYSLLLLIPTLFLQSCIIEGEEEIWIKADGSGKVRIQYTFPSVFEEHLGNPERYLNAIREIDEEEKSVKVGTLTYEKFGKKSLFGGQKCRFLLEASFDDIMEFTDVAKRNEEDFLSKTGADPSQIDSITGKIDFEMDFLSPRIQRTISLKNLLPERMQRYPGTLGKSNFSYIFHLPFPLEETNAHSLSPDRKTAKWNFRLKDHINQPLEMNMTTTIPMPWWLIAIISILAFLILRFLYRRFRRK